MKLGTLAAALVAAHAGILLAATGAAVPLQPAADDLRHVVVQGDTLYGLSQHYLASHQLWPALQRRNAIVDPLRLQPGQIVYIPAHLLPTHSVAATVDFVHGSVQTVAAPNKPATRVAAGTQLPEGTRLQVAEGSYVSVKLADGSVIKVEAGADVTLERMRQRPADGRTALGIGLQRGSVQSIVPPRNTPGRRFDIRTPLAVASVRGTEFDVSVADGGGTTTSVTRGVVAVQAPSPASRAPAPSTELLAGEGNAVIHPGLLGKTAKLLPAPDLSALPGVVQDTDAIVLGIAALPLATAYRVRIAQDEALVQVVRNATFSSPQFRFESLPDGAYFVGVRAVDASGIAGLQAQQALAVKVLKPPPPPFYQLPTPGAQVPGPKVTFQCTGVPGVQWFHLQVSSREDFAQPEVNADRLSVCEYTTPTLAPGLWYWRVASVNQRADGQPNVGPFAAAQNFTVLPLAPAFVSTGAATEDTKVFWEAQAGHTYRIQVARDAAFTHLVADQTVEQAAWNFTTLPPSVYYMRIQSINSAGVASVFSEARQLNTQSILRTGDGDAVQLSDGTSVVRP